MGAWGWMGVMGVSIGGWMGEFWGMMRVWANEWVSAMGEWVDGCWGWTDGRQGREEVAGWLVGRRRMNGGLLGSGGWLGDCVGAGPRCGGAVGTDGQVGTRCGVSSGCPCRPPVPQEPARGTPSTPGWARGDARGAKPPLWQCPQAGAVSAWCGAAALG